MIHEGKCKLPVLIVKFSFHQTRKRCCFLYLCVQAYGNWPQYFQVYTTTHPMIFWLSVSKESDWPIITIILFILMVSKIIIFNQLVVLDKFVGPGSRLVLFIENISEDYLWAGRRTSG